MRGGKTFTSSLFNLCRCTFHKLMAHKDICRNIYFWAILALHNLIQDILCPPQICKSVSFAWKLSVYVFDSVLQKRVWAAPLGGSA